MKRRSEELASEKDILKVPPLPSALMISYLPKARFYPHQFQPLWSGEIRDLTQALRSPRPVGSSLKSPSV